MRKKKQRKIVAPAVVVQAVVAPADWTSSRVNISVFSFLEETNKCDATLTGDKIPVWNAATHAKFNAERLYLLLLSSHFLLLSDYVCFSFCLDIQTAVSQILIQNSQHGHICDELAVIFTCACRFLFV